MLLLLLLLSVAVSGLGPGSSAMWHSPGAWPGRCTLHRGRRNSNVRCAVKQLWSAMIVEHWLAHAVQPDGVSGPQHKAIYEILP